MSTENKNVKVPENSKQEKIKFNPGDNIQIFTIGKQLPHKGKFISQTVNMISWINCRGIIQAKALTEVSKVENCFHDHLIFLLK